jgi:hypothetical protein
MISFKEFIDAYQDGSIENNITWRAYDIKNATMPIHTKQAIRNLCYKYAREHAIPKIQADYGLASATETAALLGYWWLLRRMTGYRAARIRVRKPNTHTPSNSQA